MNLANALSLNLALMKCPNTFPPCNVEHGTASHHNTNMVCCFQLQLTSTALCFTTLWALLAALIVQYNFPLATVCQPMWSPGCCCNTHGYMCSTITTFNGSIWVCYRPIVHRTSNVCNSCFPNSTHKLSCNWGTVMSSRYDLQFYSWLTLQTMPTTLYTRHTLACCHNLSICKHKGFQMQIWELVITAETYLQVIILGRLVV